MSNITDLEMTRLCAEAMGYRILRERKASKQLDYGDAILVKELSSVYWPLHDDAQAMALVKKFHILIGTDSNHWTAFIPTVGRSIHSTDLNRAIVECVAKMRREKRK